MNFWSFKKACLGGCCFTCRKLQDLVAHSIYDRWWCYWSGLSCHTWSKRCEIFIKQFGPWSIDDCFAAGGWAAHPQKTRPKANREIANNLHPALELLYSRNYPHIMECPGTVAIPWDACDGARTREIFVRANHFRIWTNIVMLCCSGNRQRYNLESQMPGFVSPNELIPVNMWRFTDGFPCFAQRGFSLTAAIGRKSCLLSHNWTSASEDGWEIKFYDVRKNPLSIILSETFFRVIPPLNQWAALRRHRTHSFKMDNQSR
jgi:hypothetical protein